MVEGGLIIKASARTFQETLVRLEAAMLERRMTLFASVDHAEGAKAVGMELRPTTGNDFWRSARRNASDATRPIDRA